jgi:hypothetical protein
MKTLILNLIIVSISLQFYAPKAISDDEENPKISWEQTTVNLGEVQKDKPVPATFTFDNISNEPIIISSVKASCGCTTSSYTKKPVQPGSKGNITITYNARKTGAFHKTVRVYLQGLANPVVLHVKGKVVQQL